MFTIKAAVAAGVLATSILSGSSVQADPNDVHDRLLAKVHLCKYEDGSGGPLPCVWDAKHMGNGSGDSLVVRANGSIHYVSHRRAHHLMVTFD